MKRFLLIALFLPIAAVAQKKKPIAKPKVTKVAPAPKAADGFTIDGTAKGFADGTPVALLNGQTGAPEQETTIKGGKYSFKGKVEIPDFKIILFNKKPPYITLFLDNSNVKVEGESATIDQSVVTGSASHNDFAKFNQQMAPYQALFSENPVYDSAAVANALVATENFVKQNPASYISPLAAIRYSQLSENPGAVEPLYNLLSDQAKATSMGVYLTQVIADAKRNAIGTEFPDFTQNDTTGKPVSLSSLRGKYVLIDFWASWCRPCRQENPNVVANYQRYKDKNFTVLGVSLDKAKQAWVDAINMDGLTWAHVSDLQGWANAVAAQFGIQSIPQNFLIGPDGKIIAKNLRGPALERKLAQLLH